MCSGRDKLQCEMKAIVMGCYDLPPFPNPLYLQLYVEWYIFTVYETEIVELNKLHSYLYFSVVKYISIQEFLNLFFKQELKP